MQCDSPITLKFDPPRLDDKGQFMYTFPAGCGKCLPCLMKRKAQWSLRLVEEMRNSFSAYFVTLTYDNKYVPYGDDGYTANKNDHSHFIKFLKYYEKQKVLSQRPTISLEEFQRSKLNTNENKRLKYYGIIEYGSRFGRPHWHYILFNLRDSHNIRSAWSCQVRYGKHNQTRYEPGEPYGKIDVQECNVNTIDYVLKYMIKPINENYDEQTKQREMSFVSKGMGLDLMDNELIRHIQAPDGNALLNIRGTKVGVPRYYQKKHLTDEQRDKKVKFISKQQATEDARKDMLDAHFKTNRYIADRNAKENRYNSLKNTKKRPLE